LGPRRSALANLPEDESRFPVATWLKGLLGSGVQQLILNSLLIRRASPPGKGRDLEADGSNLPWVVHDLEEKFPESLEAWLAHLRTALPDLEGVRTVERPDDRHRYLMLRYQGSIEVPSWMASDGTLRLLALTLPAYLPTFEGIYLIEEPENGIHPRAVETMIQSLTSVYDAQILLATHSPVILSTVDPEEVLCFAKTDEGATDIVLGSEHPALREWRGETNLGTLFAAGVLG
jgi:predicted ATPase